MTDKKRKNNLYTLGYFLKRLRDCNFIALKVFNEFRPDDNRKWVILVDPGNTSVFITCIFDKHTKKHMYRLEGFGPQFGKHFNIETNSMEIIVEALIMRGVQQVTKENPFIKKDD